MKVPCDDTIFTPLLFYHQVAADDHFKVQNANINLHCVKAWRLLRHFFFIVTVTTKVSDGVDLSNMKLHNAVICL